MLGSVGGRATGEATAVGSPCPALAELLWAALWPAVSWPPGACSTLGTGPCPLLRGAAGGAERTESRLQTASKESTECKLEELTFQLKPQRISQQETSQGKWSDTAQVQGQAKARGEVGLGMTVELGAGLTFSGGHHTGQVDIRREHPYAP